MLGARYGTTAGGGMTTREYSGTTGAVWRGGGLIASAKRVIADPVDVSDRRYTAAMAGPNTLHPGSELWSGLVSVHQALGETAELRLGLLRLRPNQPSHQRPPTPWSD